MATMITAKQVKKLRDETGAPIMDAKRALTESGGNVEKAKAWLKKRGMMRADKTADRETGVTAVFSYVHFNGKIGTLVKLACETDFVAKTDDFQNLGRELAMQVASMKPATPDELMTQDYLRDPKKTIEELVKEVQAKTGENVRIIAIAML